MEELELLVGESFCPASESTASHKSHLPSIHNTSYEFQSRQPFCIALTSFSDQTPVKSTRFDVNDTVTERFIYKDQLEPVAKLDGDGNILEQYVYGETSHTPGYITLRFSVDRRFGRGPVMMLKKG